MKPFVRTTYKYSTALVVPSICQYEKSNEVSRMVAATTEIARTSLRYDYLYYF